MRNTPSTQHEAVSELYIGLIEPELMVNAQPTEVYIYNAPERLPVPVVRKILQYFRGHWRTSVEELDERTSLLFYHKEGAVQ